ncbi:MAG: CoA transferase [Acidimicrobiales bacterium]|nr:CoA transferase [Acidimicrobiales bacterium]
MRRLGISITERSGVELDTLALLAERAAISGFTRNGDQSCGAGTRLLHAVDGWVAVTLVRPDDLDAVPAWLESKVDGDLWEQVADAVATRRVETLVERARLLALPVAALAQSTAPITDTATDTATRADRPKPIDEVLVVDLSSLWAGPLCGHVLHLAGASVVKVESAQRPDGARRGPKTFFDLLNGGKQSVALDFQDADGVAALQKLVARADVVIEASRPRALEQLGVHPGASQVWVSITAYGRASDGVGFGDDTAVAGGLVVWDDAGPCFCVDAVADPLTGLVAAERCLAALRTGKTGVIDVPLAGVAAAFAGPTLTVGRTAGVEVAPPRARTPTDAAPEFGADNEAVLRGL